MQTCLLGLWRRGCSCGVWRLCWAQRPSSRWQHYALRRIVWPHCCQSSDPSLSAVHAYRLQTSRWLRCALRGNDLSYGFPSLIKVLSDSKASAHVSTWVQTCLLGLWRHDCSCRVREGCAGPSARESHWRAVL